MVDAGEAILGLLEETFKVEAPLEIICRELPRFWQTSRRLRCWSTDCQIFGHEYCAEGAIAEIYLKHCPKAKEINAHWKDNVFAWGEDKKEACWLPQPVIDWINQYHGKGTGEILRGNLARLNDQGINFKAIALIIRLNFNVTTLVAPDITEFNPQPTT